MIKVNEDFEFERDQYQWQLHQWRDGLNKDKEPTRTKTTTYHSTLMQVCEVIIDRSAGKAEGLEEMMGLISFAHRDLSNAIKALTPPPTPQEE